MKAKGFPGEYFSLSHLFIQQRPGSGAPPQPMNPLLWEGVQPHPEQETSQFWGQNFLPPVAPSFGCITFHLVI